MKKTIKSSIIMACFGFLMAGALTLQAAEKAELTRASVVVVAQPEFSVMQVSSFAWASSHADVSKGFMQSDFSVSALIDEAIKQALKKKSYPLGTATTHTLSIQYHVALASEINEMDFLREYGLSPGLRSNAHTQNHQRGILLVELFAPELKKVVWRGAVEVFIGLEDTLQGRQTRVNGLLDELFSRLPAKIN